MSKKIISVFFGLSLMGTFSSSAMYNSAFRAIQLVTGGALIGKGLYDFDCHNKILKNPVKGEPMPGVAQSFLRAKMRKLNVPEGDTMPLLIQDGANGWGAVNDSAIISSRQEVADFEENLNDKLLVVKKINELVQVRNDHKKHNANFERFAQKKIVSDPRSRLSIRKYSENHFRELDNIISELQQVSDQCDRHIALQSTFFKHELQHFKGQHGKSAGLAIGIMPIVVQAGCSGLTYATNKLLCRKGPATLLSFCVRFGMSAAGIKSKIFLNALGVALYGRHLETEADQFACENAETRLELQEGYNCHLYDLLSFKKEHCNNASLLFGINQDLFYRWHFFDIDSDHPYPADRAAMFKKYLDAWGAEHANQELKDRT